MVSVFKIPWTELTQVSADRLLASLDDLEKKKFEQIVEYQYKIRYARSVFLKKSILSRYLKTTVDSISLGTEGSGRPFLKYPKHNLDFNVSHSDTLFIIALSECGSVGSDVEEIHNIDLRISSEFCNNGELQYLSERTEEQKRMNFFVLWTLKEAYVKALGEGLRFPLKDICFEIEDLSAVRVKNMPENTWSFDVRIIDNHVFSICSSGKVPLDDFHYIELKSTDF